MLVLSSSCLQFLAQLKLMDYSLLVGIHDVERAEQEDVESEDNEAEEEGESDGGGIGTPPDSPSNTLDSTKPLSPGEFDPTIDVYAIKSNDGEQTGFKTLTDPRAPSSGHSYCQQRFSLWARWFQTAGAPRKEVYFMAVIDILQHYDAKKKAAHAAKTVKHGVCQTFNLFIRNKNKLV